MSEALTGLVLKGIGGFYYVQCGDTLDSCRARGKVRKDRISPYAGDRVRFTVDENGEGYLSEILPRKNFLVRRLQISISCSSSPRSATRSRAH